MININLIALFILLNLPILIFFNSLILKFNIYDHGDSKRKIHTYPISLFGGTIIIYNFIIAIIINFFFETFLIDKDFLISNRENFTFIFGSILFYFLGLFDDKYILNSNKKFLLSFILVYLILSIDETLIIKEITLLDFDTIELYGFSKPFSILCFLLFLNALNMFDGINLQAALYSLIIFFIFLLKNLNFNFNIIILFSLILFLYFNYKNKCFLGDSGSNLLFFIISYTIIKNYNLDRSFQIEEIYILMFLPGLDMFRLFLFRLIKGNNPFKPDNEHIHHIILKLIKQKTKTALFIFFLNIFVIATYYFISHELIYCIIITVLYFLFVYFVYFKIKSYENS